MDYNKEDCLHFSKTFALLSFSDQSLGIIYHRANKANSMLGNQWDTVPWLTGINTVVTMPFNYICEFKHKPLSHTCCASVTACCLWERHRCVSVTGTTLNRLSVWLGKPGWQDDVTSLWHLDDMLCVRPTTQIFLREKKNNWELWQKCDL